MIQGRLTNPHPVDLQAAEMCLPFSVALAAYFPLAKGRVPTLAVADYEAGLTDPRLHAIEERTTIALDDEVEAASNALSTAAKVAVRLRDGRVLEKFVPAPKAAPVIRSRRRSTRRASCRNCRRASPTRTAPRSSRCRRTSIGSTPAGSAKC